MAKKPTPKKVADARQQPKQQESVAAEVARLCNEFKHLTLEVRAVEEQQKERNKKLAAMSGRLVELIEMSDLQPPFYPEGGGRVSVKKDISVKQEDKQALLHSLEALGLQDLIQSNVNTNSLASAVRERLEKHEPLPDGIIVTPYQKAVFTAS